MGWRCMAQKKADPQGIGHESFRRGCLKGLLYVRCSIAFRKCEKSDDGCRMRNRCQRKVQAMA
jgi:hypothetical protein